MSSGMPELGSKISLISKADIRYEGRLFTVDPQECTIALSNVRSFGTEDREAQIPVLPQANVYEYILFRGSDIKDIKVLNNVPSIPNDPAIVQMTMLPSIGQQSYQQQTGYTPLMGQIGPMSGPSFNMGYGPMALNAMGMRMQPGVQDPRTGLNKQPSELLPGGLSAFAEQSPPNPIVSSAPTATPHINDNLAKDRSLEDGVLELIGGGSRSTTPTSLLTRKSPTIDQGTQAGHQQSMVGKIGDNANRNNMQRNNMRDSYGSGRTGSGMSQYSDGKSKQQDHGQGQHGGGGRGNRGAGWINRGTIRGRGRGGGGRGGGGMGNNFNRNQTGNAAQKAKNTLKFDKEYDFESANSEFEELRSQFAKTKLDGGVDNEKKDDSGNETGAGEGEQEEEPEIVHYDKSKSFFDNISCEAVERSKGRSQRTDWRTERKLNSETFGVASMRRGNYRGYYNRGGGGGGMGSRGGGGGMYRGSGTGGNAGGGGFRGYRGGGNRGQGNRNKQQQQQPQQPQQQPNTAPTQTNNQRTTEPINSTTAQSQSTRLVSGTA